MIDNLVWLFPAFLAGLFGNVHCLAMCGGLSSAIGLSLTRSRFSQSKITQLQFFYNMGRVTTYGLLGAFFGTAGAFLNYIIGNIGIMIMKILAGVFLILLGLYLSNIWKGLKYVERLGGRVWHILQPTFAKKLQIHSTSSAYAAGALWGLLPCGLVYSTLSWSATSAHPLSGFFIMISFGLGTLPAMLLTGVLAQRFVHILSTKQLQICSGVMVMSFGAWILFGSTMMHYFHHMHHG